MSNNKKGKQFFSIGSVFFLLIVIPLSLMAFLIANGIFKLGVTIQERTAVVLDQKAQEDIKARAINTANEVAGFLTESKKDLLIATIIPPTETAFRQFVLENRKPIWARDGKRVQQVLVPLYKEMSLIDRKGKELIKVVDGKVMPESQLKNVSIPANTTYKNETYFAQAQLLNKGEVYVSPVTGLYVTKDAFNKGARFNGIIRLATPLFDKDGFAGVIALALDYRHLATFTNHIIPTQMEKVYEVDATAGNYAYIIDHRGYVIVHPSSYHIVGLNAQGVQVPTLNERNANDLMKKGIEALNLHQLGFMDPNLPVIAKEAAAGKSGVLSYKFGGHAKFVAYAPIKFYTKNLPAPAGFGWVGMGIDVDKYKEAALKVAQNIDKEAKAWTATIIFILVASMIILFLIMWLLMRGINRSIAAEVPEGSEQPLDFDDDDD